MKRARGLVIAGSLGVLMSACGGNVGDVDDTSGGEPRGGKSQTGDGASGAGGRRGSGGRAANGAASGSEAGGAGGRGQGAGVGAGGRHTMIDGGAFGVGGEAGPSSGGSGAGPDGDGSATEVWVGQVQATITFPEYPDIRTTPQHVVMVLRTSASGAVTGSVLFGDHEPPSAATDPEAFYPDNGTPVSNLTYLRRMPLNGFAYSLLDLHVQDGRVTARFAPSELWSDWCALQTTSYPSSRYPDYPETCAPDDAPFSPGSALAQHKADLCLNSGPPACRCAANVCQADPNPNFIWSLDVALRDGVYEGKVDPDGESFPDTLLPWLRLRRVE